MKPPYEIKNVPKNIQLIMDDGEKFSIPLECFDYLNIEDRIIYGKGDKDENINTKMIIKKEYSDKFYDLEGILSIDMIGIDYGDKISTVPYFTEPFWELQEELPEDRLHEIYPQQGIINDNGSMTITVKQGYIPDEEDYYD